MLGEGIMLGSITKVSTNAATMMVRSSDAAIAGNVGSCSSKPGHLRSTMLERTPDVLMEPPVLRWQNRAKPYCLKPKVFPERAEPRPAQPVSWCCRCHAPARRPVHQRFSGALQPGTACGGPARSLAVPDTPAFQRAWPAGAPAEPICNYPRPRSRATLQPATPPLRPLPTGSREHAPAQVHPPETAPRSLPPLRWKAPLPFAADRRAF